MSRLGTSTLWVMVVLCAGCGPQGVAPPAEKQLYTFQGELEAQINGAPGERERLAALLPLRILLAKFAGEGPATPSGTCDGKEGLGGYTYWVLEYIDKNNVQEAVPLLERALHKDNRLYGESRERNLVADIWLRLQTRRMADEDRARLAVSLLGPSQPLDVAGAAYGMLPSLGENGKVGLLKMLAENQKEMGPQDGMQAGLVASLLNEPGLRPTDEEVSLILKNQSGYTKVVMCMYLAEREDVRALKLLREIWDRYPGDHPSLARFAPLGSYSIGAVKGAAPVLLELLHKLDSEKKTPRTGQDRSFVLACIMNTEARARSADLEDYIRNYLTRDLPRVGHDGTLPTMEQFKVLYQEIHTRGIAKRILEMWVAQDKDTEDR